MNPFKNIPILENILQTDNQQYQNYSQLVRWVRWLLIQETNIFSVVRYVVVTVFILPDTIPVRFVVFLSSSFICQVLVISCMNEPYYENIADNINWVSLNQDFKAIPSASNIMDDFYDQICNVNEYIYQEQSYKVHWSWYLPNRRIEIPGYDVLVPIIFI